MTSREVARDQEILDRRKRQVSEGLAHTLSTYLRLVGGLSSVQMTRRLAIGADLNKSVTTQTIQDEHSQPTPAPEPPQPAIQMPTETAIRQKAANKARKQALLNSGQATTTGTTTRRKAHRPVEQHHDDCTDSMETLSPHGQGLVQFKT